jgi:uncharacterized protein
MAMADVRRVLRTALAFVRMGCMPRIDQPSSDQSLVVVTGASSGIGLELALCAARDRHPLLLVARGVDALEQAAVACTEAGSPATHVCGADLATQAGVDAVVAQVEAIDLPVAALVNNAGFGTWGPFAQQDADRIAGMVDLNCGAVVLLTRRLLDRVVAARGGVLTVASTASFQPGPGMAVYHATKSFALYFSVALRDELRSSGVRVTALCPGPVPTGFNEVAGVGPIDDRLLAKVATQRADAVARAGWRGLRRNDAVVVPGAANRLGALGAKLSPLALVTPVTRMALGAVDRRGRALDQPRRH